MTATPSVTITSNNAADQFTHFTNSGIFNVASGLGSANSPYTGVTLNGFTNEGIGSITVGAVSKVTVSNFQSYGTLVLNPAVVGSGQFTLLTNLGAAPLGFNSGSRTYIGAMSEGPGGPNFVAGINLSGKNAVVVGGVFVNNGFVLDSTNGATGTATVIADYGARW